MTQDKASKFAMVAAMVLLLTACKTTGTYPAREDVEAATEAKPAPTAAILTDPNADARYNASIEAWGDRVRAAGVRLCRFYERTGMPGIACPQ
ncbi:MULTISPECIES: hypothetical protein [unclassified Novosphingobium]|uniref:hypothetical protein n=1 Tax=unclassified Novosphingobium TaxID=2644732 RepID=UPI00135B2F28|nr:MULTISPECIES: hypothetical protein [unclassified Novosphingobium]